MQTVMFVHGTGVREPAYRTSFGLVQKLCLIAWARTRCGRSPATTEIVAENVAVTLQRFRDVLTSIPNAGQLYPVSEVKLSIAVDGRGEASVMSVAKGSLGGRAELQFILKRAE